MPRPAPEGRPRLVCEPLDSGEPCPAPIKDAREARRAAIEEIRGDRGRDGVGDIRGGGFKLALESVEASQRH